MFFIRNIQRIFCSRCFFIRNMSRHVSTVHAFNKKHNGKTKLQHKFFVRNKQQTNPSTIYVIYLETLCYHQFKNISKAEIFTFNASPLLFYSEPKCSMLQLFEFPTNFKNSLLSCDWVLIG